MHFSKKMGKLFLVLSILTGLLFLKPTGIAYAASPTATINIADTSLIIGETSTVTITFSEPVNGFDNADLTIPNGTLSEVASTDGGITWMAMFTPAESITDATNVITLDNMGVKNGAGHAGLGSTDSNNYAIDTVRPTATIIVAETSLAAGETSLVTITFSEPVTGFTYADLTIANGTISAVSTSDNITYSATFTPTAGFEDLTNVITLDNMGVIDSAGNVGTGTTNSNNYAIDTVRPTATIVVADTSLAAGETSLVTVTFSEAVSGFDNEDLMIASGTLSAVGSADGGITWTATFTPAENLIKASNVITLDITGVQDAAGNGGEGNIDSNNYAIHTSRPTATVVVSDTSLTIGETAEVRITFSEMVTGFTNDDLTIDNGTLSAVSSSDGGITWTATFTPRANVSVSRNLITLDNSGVYNTEGNAGQGTTASNSYSVFTVPIYNGGAPLTPTAPIDNTVTAINGQITLPVGKSGVVSLGDEIRISIPAGASTQELKLSIVEVLNTEALLKNHEMLASPVFELLKNFSENFSKPVLLTLKFDPASLKSNQTAAVFYYDEAKKVWVNVEGGIVQGNQISVEVNHFTKYAALVVDQTTGMPVIDKPADIVTEVNFSDMSGHWAERSIKRAVSEGVINGYPDGMFKPGKTVTRAEFTVMLMNAMGMQEKGAELTFTDTAQIGAWAQTAVAQAVGAGVINGYNDGTFRPNANISRAEMAAMIANALKLSIEERASTPFADDKAIPAWAKGAVAALKERGIINGSGANEFKPGGQTTRAEAVIVVMNMLEHLNNE